MNASPTNALLVAFRVSSTAALALLLLSGAACTPDVFESPGSDNTRLAASLDDLLAEVAALVVADAALDLAGLGRDDFAVDVVHGRRDAGLDQALDDAVAWRYGSRL